MLAIETKNINKLAEKLAEKNQVFVPFLRTDGECVFKQFEKGDTINLDYQTTILPIKNFFIPGKERLFTFDIKKKKTTIRPKSKNTIIFGLNLRDAEALVQLDEIMQNDYFYFEKRNASTIVSIVDEGRTMPTSGIDLILKKIGPKEYKVAEKSKKGEKIMKNKLFTETTREPTNQPTNKLTNKPMPELRKLLLDAEILHDAVKWSRKGTPEIWDKLAKQCIACGICTYVCPLCYCFSVEDRCELSGKTCLKNRHWAACTLPEFAKVSGGHNFHATLKERYYNWFYHKFVRAYTEYGKSQCVACGRCQKYCPAQIDIEKVLVDIVTNFQSKK